MNNSLLNHLSEEEIAAAHIPPHDLSASEKATADTTLLHLRMAKLRDQTESQRVLAGLVRLKFQMEDFLQTKGNPESKVCGSVGLIE